MFEQFVKRPFHLALYRTGPYAEERSRFLAHLVQKGRCPGRLKALNWLLLEVRYSVRESNNGWLALKLNMEVDEPDQRAGVRSSRPRR